MRSRSRKEDVASYTWACGKTVEWLLSLLLHLVLSLEPATDRVGRGDLISLAAMSSGVSGEFLNNSIGSS